MEAKKHSVKEHQLYALLSGKCCLTEADLRKERVGYASPRLRVSPNDVLSSGEPASDPFYNFRAHDKDVLIPLDFS